MLKRVEIRGYKSLVDVKLDLKPLVVLFGPNAAGKSNFLDALQLLSRIPVSRTLKEAFEPPYRGKPLESFSLGSEGIPKLLTTESATFSMQADIELSDRVVESVNRQIGEMKAPVNGAGPKDNGEPAQIAFVKERSLRYGIEVEILPRSGLKAAALDSSLRHFLTDARAALHFLAST